MKIQLPIDTSAVPIDVMPLEPVLDRQTKQQKADANGEPPYRIELVRIGAEGGEIPSVKSPGTPPDGIRQGMAVTVKRPIVTDWGIGDRFGLTFGAVEAEPLSADTASDARLA
jgi:hypothetical protein